MTGPTRDGLEQWLRSIMETRMEPGSPLIVLQNRWSTDDIYARLQEHESADEWKFINLESIAESLPDELGRKEGESLWPERWSVEALQKKKKAVGSAIFESQYQGRPTPEHGRLVNPAWFQSYSILPTPPPPKPFHPLQLVYDDPFDAAQPAQSDFIRVTGVDCAGVSNDASRGSYSALVSLMYDVQRGDFFVTDVERFRGISFEELRSNAIRHFERNRIDMAIIEEAALGSRLIGDLQSSNKVPVRPVQPKTSKEDRLIQVIPYLEGGKVFIPEHSTWRQIFLRELSDFGPQAKNSDIVDAFVWAMLYIRRARQYRRADALFDHQIAGLSDWSNR
jgi:predicted phage terminase large subunit-like protein